jgi:hypothetical protein
MDSDMGSGKMSSSSSSSSSLSTLVVGLAGDRLCEITHFETALAPYFGLPRRSTRWFAIEQAQ